MSYISRTGNLAKTPELKEGASGPYTYARVLVTDRVRNDDDTYTDGPTIGYELTVSGSQARELVATAQRSGNVRVTFSGRYRVTEWKGDTATRTQHEVYVEEIGISLRGQTVSVERNERTEQQGEDSAF